MSKLVEKLKGLRREAAPMGFRPAEQAVSGSQMLVLGRLSQSGPGTAELASTGGRDFLDAAVYTGKKLTEVSNLAKAVSGVPLGFTAESTEVESFKAPVIDGVDFIVFGMKSAASVLEVRDIGRFLELPWDSELARVMIAAELATMIDGIIVGGTDVGVVTLEKLLACRRLVRTFNLPVIAEVTGAVTGADVRCLWEAGVDGLILTGFTRESLASVRKAIDALPTGGRKLWSSKEKRQPLLPKLGESATELEKEEE
jgi:hypothetical protein